MKKVNIAWFRSKEWFLFETAPYYRNKSWLRKGYIRVRVFRFGFNLYIDT